MSQSYSVPPDLAVQLALRDDLGYRLVDAISDRQIGPCRLGSDLKWDFHVDLDQGTRMQWLRLERCDPG